MNTSETPSTVNRMQVWLIPLALLVGILCITRLRGCNDTSTTTALNRSVVGSHPVVVLDEQGWTHGEAEWFYSIAQGSHLIPYDWLIALERPDSNQRLVDDLTTRYNYIGRARSNENPDGLPVGFVKDETWVGLTCAACHTAMIDYGGQSFLIDGGPGLGDLEGLLRGLMESLEATHREEGKFERFARNVLSSGDEVDAPAELRRKLQLVIQNRREYNQRNLPIDKSLGFGFGRVDAFGAILNEVSVKFIGVPENHRPANAPVSYPHIWDAPHHDVVQWNGSAPNKRGGDLARNVGEVLGVFGEIVVPEKPPKLGYASTVRINNLLSIERQLKRLKSPTWPEKFPELDHDAIKRGAVVYQKVCASCHSLEFDRTDDNRRIKADVQDVGTDPLMAENFRTREAIAGRLQGSKINFNLDPFGLEFGQRVNGETLLIHAVVGTILGGWKDAPDELRDKERILKSDGPNAYKARPLNGIWATAPYLHNGSVPTLRDLLRPQDDRPKTFWVGSRKFDPINVGFETAEHHPGSLFDTSQPGNSNAGHEYGTGVSKQDGGDGMMLEPHEVEDLLEFLKSL